MYLETSTSQHQHRLPKTHGDPQSHHETMCRLGTLNLRTGSYTLREALEMALDDRPLLHHVLVADIVELCDLMEHTYRIKAVTNWITATLAEGPRTKTTRTDSSLRNHSVDRIRPKRGEGPSSRQHNSKRPTVFATSDSESSQLPP